MILCVVLEGGSTAAALSYRRNNPQARIPMLVGLDEVRLHSILTSQRFRALVHLTLSLHSMSMNAIKC